FKVMAAGVQSTDVSRAVPNQIRHIAIGKYGPTKVGTLKAWCHALRCQRTHGLLFNKENGRPMRTILMAFAAVSLLMAWPDRARQDDEIFKNRSVKIGATEYQYRVFVPNGWSKKKKWP